MTPSIGTIPVVDIFAGPGGLGEGFSALKGPDNRQIFKVSLSIEKDPVAFQTLELRAFFREFTDGAPDEYYAFVRGTISRSQLFQRYPEQAAAAKRACLLAELGAVPVEGVDGRIAEALAGDRPWVLVGGPPCQAYSVAGRSRRKGIEGYQPSNDKRHFLYQEYLRIIAKHWPSVFVFENVKGLLSSNVDGRSMLDGILADLRNPSAASSAPSGVGYRYSIFALTRRRVGLLPEVLSQSDFIVRAEEHGIPQARHRFLLLGVRSDISAKPGILKKRGGVPCELVLNHIPRLRSLLPRGDDGPKAWIDAVGQVECRVPEIEDAAGGVVADGVRETLRALAVPAAGTGAPFVACETACDYLPDWFVDKRIGGLTNHEGRNHIASDLHRYLFAACYAQANGRSPRLRDFPVFLRPNHKNVEQALEGGFFQDRFRVQVKGQASTTITSHIAKDGHHFIHPDPGQCRSLTVREAARLQTFPDNYHFCRPRTSQYIQVGNAVPPLLANEIASVVAEVLDSVPLQERDGPNQ